MTTSVKIICVLCGASSGETSVFEDAAKLLDEALANRKLKLVYGGGDLGLMGAVARVTHDSGSQILDILPKALDDIGLVGTTPEDNKILVGSMHEHKATMYEHSDAFIVLPGGYGTLEEFYEVVTWSQLGIHKKPVGLLNVDGFYDLMLAFLDLIVEKGLMSTYSQNLFITESDVICLLNRLMIFNPVIDPSVSLLDWSTGERKRTN